MDRHSERNAGSLAGDRTADKRTAPSILTRRAWLGVAAGGAVLALGAERWWRFANTATIDANATPILVYASPSCSCCHAWMQHLESNGFHVTREFLSDVTPLKQKLSVPERLWSCHTAVADGYTIEGHVPADLVQKLLAERPAALGLAVPGMPKGAPGMEEVSKEKYDVIAFTRAGDTHIYAVR